MNNPRQSQLNSHNLWENLQGEIVNDMLRDSAKALFGQTQISDPNSPCHLERHIKPHVFLQHFRVYTGGSHTLKAVALWWKRFICVTRKSDFKGRSCLQYSSV